MNLTERQQRIFTFIQEHQRKQGVVPTVREICQHFGLRSPAGVHRILKVLEEKGALIAADGKKRAWRPAERFLQRGVPVVSALQISSPMLTLR